MGGLLSHLSHDVQLTYILKVPVNIRHSIGKKIVTATVHAMIFLVHKKHVYKRSILIASGHKASWYLSRVSTRACINSRIPISFSSSSTPTMKNKDAYRR
jgi:hypothetical protein